MNDLLGFLWLFDWFGGCCGGVVWDLFGCWVGIVGVVLVLGD